jgi:hypothetical protein
VKGYGIAGVALVLVCAAVAAGQQDGTLVAGRNGKPKVTVAPIERVSVTAGKAATVQLLFRVAPGYHINSHQPKSELLIPTRLSLDPPAEILPGEVTYPPGKDASFPFAPEEKLSVYSGDFSVQALVRTARNTPAGTYRVRGQLRYQACDDRACYPPATVPLQFEVSVKKVDPHVHQ